MHQPPFPFEVFELRYRKLGPDGDPRTRSLVPVLDEHATCTSTVPPERSAHEW